MKPMLSSRQNPTGDPKAPMGALCPYVRAESVKLIFFNILSFFNVHSRIITELDQRMSQPTKEVTVGDLFTKWDMYYEYYNNLDTALSTLDNICKNNKELVGYLRDCEIRAEEWRKEDSKEERKKDLSLKSLLLEPA